MTDVKATILTKGEFMGNIIVQHVWLREHGRTNYAQYNSAPYAIYRPKRKRRYMKKWIADRNPFLVILEGWVDIKTQDIFGAKRYNAETKCHVSEGKFASFDNGWQESFETENSLDKLAMIADYRGVNPFEALKSFNQDQAMECIAKTYEGAKLESYTLREDGTASIEFNFCGGHFVDTVIVGLDNGRVRILEKVAA